MIDVSQSIPSASERSAVAGLAPLVTLVFCAFLVIAVPLPALSLYVHDELGFSNFTVGWVIGLQSIATVATRHLAGGISDLNGPRRAVLLGLPLAMVAAALHLAPALLPIAPHGKIAILACGRLLLGLAESLFLTGAMSWGIGRIGPARTGRVMSWQGIAIYLAFGAGAPLGLAVHHAFGFAGVALVALLCPAISLGIALALPPVPSSGGSERVPIHEVLGLIWLPGLVLMFATVPFAAMAAFLPLDYAAKGWGGAGFAMASFGVGYILVRLVASDLPDRLGASRAIMVSLTVEAIGQLLLWGAPTPAVALVGAALSGIGFSLVFPAMGVVATRRVPPEQRGRAVGNFIAFFDVAVGLTAPLAGLLVGAFGYPSAFVAGLVSAVVALALMPAVRRMPKPA
jgi:MFS family permease